MPKVSLVREDKMIIRLRTKEDCDENFGEDYIADFGVDIPEPLQFRYLKCMEEFRAIQRELEPFKEKQEEG